METIILTFMLWILGTVCAAAGYASGHRDGKREGYTRGRAVARGAMAEMSGVLNEKTGYWCGHCRRYTLTDHSRNMVSQ